MVKQCLLHDLLVWLTLYAGASRPGGVGGCQNCGLCPFHLKFLSRSANCNSLYELQIFFNIQKACSDGERDLNLEVTENLVFFKTTAKLLFLSAVKIFCKKNNNFQ